jgi:hypothetical protein
MTENFKDIAFLFSRAMFFFSFFFFFFFFFYEVHINGKKTQFSTGYLKPLKRQIALVALHNYAFNF